MNIHKANHICTRCKSKSTRFEAKELKKLKYSLYRVLYIFTISQMVQEQQECYFCDTLSYHTLEPS